MTPPEGCPYCLTSPDFFASPLSFASYRFGVGFFKGEVQERAMTLAKSQRGGEYARKGREVTRTRVYERRSAFRFLEPAKRFGCPNSIPTSVADTKILQWLVRRGCKRSVVVEFFGWCFHSKDIHKLAPWENYRRNRIWCYGFQPHNQLLGHKAQGTRRRRPSSHSIIPCCPSTTSE